MAVKFTIGEVAKALGISQERIRHYVNEGLIQPERKFVDRKSVVRERV